MHARPADSQVADWELPNTVHTVEQGIAQVHTELQSGSVAIALFGNMANAAAMTDTVSSVFMMYSVLFREMTVGCVIRRARPPIRAFYLDRKPRRFCICAFAGPNPPWIGPTSKNSWS